MTLDSFRGPRVFDAPPRRNLFDVDPDEMVDDEVPGADIAEPAVPTVELDTVRVSRPVGRGGHNPADVRAVRRALNVTGHLRSPRNVSARADRNFHTGLTNFQTEVGVKPDGLITPGGPTETALNVALAADRIGGPPAQAAAKKTLNDRGLVFARDPKDPDAPPRWRDRNGTKVSGPFAQAGPGSGPRRMPTPVPPPPPKPVIPIPERPPFGRKPAGAPYAGRWTVPGSRASGAATNPKSDPYPQSRVSAKFRYMLHTEESERDNYAAFNKDGNAHGRYQLTSVALRDIGVKERNNNWTGKFGATSERVFLTSPLAQEKALEAFMQKNEGYFRSNKFDRFVGQTLSVGNADVKLSRDNILAAMHRWGIGGVEESLTALEKAGWRYTALPANLSSNLRKRLNEVVRRLAVAEKVRYAR